MSRAESVFASDNPSPLQVGVGIALRPDGGALREEKGAGWMSYWQPADRDRGSIGCAVVFPAGGIREFTAESATLPRLTPAQLSTPDGEGLQPVADLPCNRHSRTGQTPGLLAGRRMEQEAATFPTEPPGRLMSAGSGSVSTPPVRVTWSAD